METENCVATSTTALGTTTEQRFCSRENSLNYHTQYMYDIILFGAVAWMIYKWIKRK